VQFDWDEQKAAANERKHGVSFEEASSAFNDENGLVLGDPDHSEAEHRFVLLGASTRQLLLVCHCYREDDTVIRIISARPANKRERDTYRRRFI
jgi:uncharacterized DUF497 family protein